MAPAQKIKPFISAGVIVVLSTREIESDFADISKVERLAKEAFPPEEYMAPSELIKMAKNDGFDFLALYDGDVFIGFMAVMFYKQMCYLFFLAVDSSFRSKGYGGQAIQALKKMRPGRVQVVDFEMTDDKAGNREQRERRRLFYLRNGYMATGHFLSYLGVDYEIFCMADNFDFEMFRELMMEIKIKDFNPFYF